MKELRNKVNLIEYKAMRRMSSVVDALKSPLKNDYAFGGDTDEGTAVSKGVRWVIVGVLGIIVVVAFAAAVTNLNWAKTTMDNIFTNLKGKAPALPSMMFVR